MKRRDFMRSAALVGASAGLVRTSRVWAMSLGVNKKRRSSLAFQQDESDRSRDRDPLAIHRSTLVVNGLDVSALNGKYLGMLKTGGVNCWYKSMGGLQSFADVYNLLDKYSDEIVAATTVREIRQLHEKGKISLIFGWQSAEALGMDQLDALRGPPRTALRAYYQLGLRICGIAYNLANIFGAGNFEPHIGLTRAGRRLVEEIYNLRIILDVGGHTGEQTSLDAIAMSAGVPVICSHTNVAAIADNPRCTSDRIIKAIAKTGGVIGLTAVNDFHVRGKKDMNVPHSPRVTVEELLDQFEYLRKLVGVDHIGVAPDFVAGRSIDYDLVNQSAAINREIISDGRWLYVKGFENISKLPNVTRGLIQRGWSTGEIRKVLGENWLRVYKQVWGA